VRESKAFQRARTLSKDDPERKRLFREARQQNAFSDYALQTSAKPFLHSWQKQLGRSVGRSAPRRFVSLLSRLAASACGVSAQRDLYSAYLARFVNPETSVLKARQAEVAWRRGEPLMQVAYQHATLNQRAIGRHLLSSFGQPSVDLSQSASPATGRPANAKTRQAVAKRQRKVRGRNRRR
jgi:hypothetical protein